MLALKNKVNEKKPLNEKYNGIFATRLREILDTRGISQYRFAKDIGTTAQNVSHYCLGNSVPHPAMLVVIAKKLNVSVDYLLGITDNESTSSEIRAISDYTGLTTASIEVLHEYQQVELFSVVINYLLKDLKLLESIADYLVTPFLNGPRYSPHDQIKLTLPVNEALSTVRALDVYRCAITAQESFVKENAANDELKKYVVARYIAELGIDPWSNTLKQSSYSAHSILHSLAENEAAGASSECEDTLQTPSYFGISDADLIKKIEAAFEKEIEDAYLKKEETAVKNRTSSTSAKKPVVE